MTILKSGLLRIWAQPDADPQHLREVLRSRGQQIAVSTRHRVERVAGLVVKRSRFDSISNPFRLTFLRERYRRAWTVGRRLIELGVGAPRIQGFAEWRIGPLILGNAIIMDDLSGCRTIRDYALVVAREGPDASTAFLQSLAQFLLSLESAGIYHSDLAWKNLLTNDGVNFFCLDLDSIEVNTSYSHDDRLRNHVQIVDALYDIWAPGILKQFISRLVPKTESADAWWNELNAALDQRILKRTRFETGTVENFEAWDARKRRKADRRE